MINLASDYNHIARQGHFVCSMASYDGVWADAPTYLAKEKAEKFG